METTANNFENQTDAFMLENEQSFFNMQSDYFPGPDDEEDDKQDDNEDENSNDADDDNPPLDEEVVHSPLTTENGGKPKTKA